MQFFSIGVTTYDREEMLIETLSSLLKQSFSDFEVVVANDNPARKVTGESLGITDPRIRFVNHPRNLGEFENMNSLLPMSTGRYFTWLADDDLYAPEFLQAIHDALERFDYPACAFSSFQEMIAGGEPDHRPVWNEDVMQLTGREFLRRYLAHELKAIGVMGFFERQYLESTGGLEDVSADGKGLYCEYMLMVKAGLLDRVAYINAPLVCFRVHEATWLMATANVEQYERATVNLVHRSIDCLRQPQLLTDFDSNLVNLLKWFMFEVIIVARRARPFRLPQFIKFLSFARRYIAPLKGSSIYGRARRCLLRAEIWVGWTLFKQAFLARAPQPLIRLAYLVKSLLRTNPISNDVARRTAVPNDR